MIVCLYWFGIKFEGILAMWIIWRNILIACALVFFIFPLQGQKVRTEKVGDDTLYLLKSEVMNGDTIPHVLLAEVTVVPSWNYRNKREHRVYNRMVRNIRVTLPYARMAAARLQEIDAELRYIEGEKERKTYLRDAEDRLFGEFERPLRKLTFSQGRMLIKLIDRETGNTSYELIKDFKGGFSAFFWQSVARIFGSNLKAEYHSDREDRMVEHIIILIDNGMI